MNKIKHLGYLMNEKAIMEEKLAKLEQIILEECKKVSSGMTVNVEKPRKNNKPNNNGKNIEKIKIIRQNILEKLDDQWQTSRDISDKLPQYNRTDVCNALNTLRKSTDVKNKIVSASCIKSTMPTKINGGIASALKKNHSVYLWKK